MMWKFQMKDFKFTFLNIVIILSLEKNFFSGDKLCILITSNI